MKYIHSYKLEEGKSLNDLELLTQLLSVLKLKSTTKSSIELYVDKYTLSEYQKLGMDKLYDNINTEILESFPTKKLSKDYLNCTKLWVMKHQKEPFCILDTDVVLHNMTDDVLERAKVSFLYPVSSTSYPFPTTINKPKGFDWTDREKVCFLNSLPINTSILAFTDLDFVKKYTDRYFEFVLENKSKSSKKSLDYVIQSEAKAIEHWLLSSMIWDKKHDEFGTYMEGFPTQSLTTAMSFPLGLNHQIYNIEPKKLFEEISGQIFHLLDAKYFYDRADKEANMNLYLEWDNLKNNLISANNDFIQYLKIQSYFDILENIEKYCREIPKGIN